MGHHDNGKSASSFEVRIGTLDDVPAMADLAGRQGYDRKATARGCERVLRERFGFSVVATTEKPEGARLVAYENACLLRPHLGTKIRCGGKPFSHTLAHENDRFVASEAEVGRANGDSGLDCFVTHFLVEQTLAPKETERTVATLASGFVERFVGNHVRAIMHEVRGLEAARETEYGGWEIVETYEPWHLRSGGVEATRSILIQAQAAGAMRHHNFLVSRMLNYHPPTLLLPPAAREVLRCAYLGWTDARIVSDLGLTSASLNSRWTRIFDIAERKMPELFAQGDGPRARDRQRLLAHIRNHPEEMWPYEPVHEG